MKKIECLISDDKMAWIDSVCKKNGYTYAEFNRRAIDFALTKMEAEYEFLVKMFNDPNIGTKRTKKNWTTKVDLGLDKS